MNTSAAHPQARSARPRPVLQAVRIRRHSCPFCGCTFARVDVARRHAKTCHQKGDRSLPPHAKRGRKQRACDSCVRSKVCCDAHLPCRRCSSRGLTCAYKRLCINATEQQLNAAEVPPNEAMLHHSRHSLSYLLNYIDPKAAPTPSPATGEPERESDGTLPWDVSLPTSPEDAFTMYPFWGFDHSMESYSSETEGLFMSSHERLFSLSPISMPAHRSNQSRLDLLYADLQELASGNTEHQQCRDGHLLATIVDPDNARKFMTAFYRRRHIQFPLIHWPTFRIDEASLPLLLAVILTGMVYTHGREGPLEHSEMQSLYRVSEEYVFRHLRQCSPSTHIPLKIIPRKAVEACQAALLFTALNLGSFDSLHNHKVVTVWHPALVTALRNLGLLRQGQPTFPVAETADPWLSFIEHESYVRLVTWSFFFDMLCTTFLNHAPLITMAELMCQLPCDEEIWDAASADEFARLRYENQSATLYAEEWNLKNLVSGLLNVAQWTETSQHCYERLTVRRLHAIICGLHTALYHAQAALLPGPTVSTTFLRALDRWDALWSGATRRATTEELRWLGVCRNGPALSSFARAIVCASETPDGRQSIYVQRVPVYDVSITHEFIKKFGTNEALARKAV